MARAARALHREGGESAEATVGMGWMQARETNKFRIKCSVREALGAGYVPSPVQSTDHPGQLFCKVLGNSTTIFWKGGTQGTIRRSLRDLCSFIQALYAMLVSIACCVYSTLGSLLFLFSFGSASHALAPKGFQLMALADRSGFLGSLAGFTAVLLAFVKIK